MPAGKTTVNGTECDITAGKTMVNGTAHDITAGKTMIEGTMHNIAFASALPPLEYILSDMTLVVDGNKNIDGSINAGLQDYAYTNVIDDRTIIFPHYIFALCDGNLAIIKANSMNDMYYLNRNWVNYDVTIYIGGSMAHQHYYYHAVYDAQTKTQTREKVFGASVVVVRFPNYSEDEVDAVLRGMSIAKVDGRNNSFSANVRTNTDKGHQFYITTKYQTNGTSYTGNSPGNTGFVIWSCDGTTWTKFNQVTPSWQAGRVSSGYLTLGSCYGGSIVALDEA